MSRNTKPRRSRWQPTADTLTLALHHAAKPPVAERAQILDMLKQAITALREGVATEYQWSIAAGALAVALAIERQGIVRGLHGHLVAAEATLQNIYDRAMRSGGGRWVRVTLYYQELDNLQTFLDLHQFQVNQLARREYLMACAAAQADTVAQGHTATFERDLQRLAA